MAVWGPILDRFEQLVRQIRPDGHPDAMAGVLDLRNAKFDGKIARVCATGPLELFAISEMRSPGLRWAVQ